MLATEKKLKTNDKYLQQLEELKLRVPKGYKDAIKDLAKEEGFNGVNPFIISLINGILKDKGKEEIPTGIKEVKKVLGEREEQ